MADREEMQAWVEQFGRRCQAKVAPEEQQRRERQFDADNARIHAESLRKWQIEKRRDSDAWLQHAVERAEADTARALRNSEVEVFIAAGPVWTPKWFNDNVAHRIPFFRPTYLPTGAGTGAILFAVARLERRLEQGRKPSSPTSLLLREVKAVMAHERTQFVSQQVADEQPALVVRDCEKTLLGKARAKWRRRQEQVAESNSARRQRGLRPVPEPGVYYGHQQSP